MDQPSTGGATTQLTTARPRGSRWRGLAVGLLAVLTCLTLVVSTVTLWTHQVVLNTDRYVSLVADISAEPQVIDSVSQQVAVQVVDALGVQTFLEANLPPKVAFVAGPLTVALTDRLGEGLAKVMASPQFQQVWLEANRFAHAKAVALLRGDTTVVTLENGVVTLNLLPLVGAALQQLQAAGLIPASITLPDLSSGQLPAELVQQLQTTFNVTIPPDLGQIPLFSAQRLERLQTAVQLFDLIVIALIVITVGLFLLTIYLARQRLRMVLLLALGAVIAFALARMIVSGIETAIVNSIADDSAQTTVRGVAGELFGNLFAFGRLVIVGALVVAAVAYLAGRPAWIGELAAATRGAAAGEAAAAGQAGPTLGDWARAHRTGLLLAGVAVLMIIVIWAALGIEFAMLAGAVLAILALLLLPTGDQRASASASAAAR